MKIQWPDSGLIFEVPGVRGKGRPRFTRFGSTYTDKKTVEYENLIKEQYEAVSDYMSDKSIQISIYVCFAPNRSDTKKNKLLKLSNELWPKKKPDIDNIIKIVLDALNKVAYQDDTQVNVINVIRHFDEKEKLVICIRENGEVFQKVKKS